MKNLRSSETDVLQTSGYQWRGGAGGQYRGRGMGGTNYWVGSRMYGKTWGIEPIFYSNCKWTLPLKIV